MIGHATQVKVNLKFQRKDAKLDELVLMRMKMGLGKAGRTAELRYPVPSSPG